MTTTFDNDEINQRRGKTKTLDIRFKREDLIVNHFRRREENNFHVCRRRTARTRTARV